MPKTLYIGVVNDHDGQDKVYVATVPHDAEDWEDNRFFAAIPSTRASTAVTLVGNVLRTGGADVTHEY